MTGKLYWNPCVEDQGVLSLFFWEDCAMRPHKKFSALSCIVLLTFFGRMRFDNKA